MVAPTTTTAVLGLGITAAVVGVAVDAFSSAKLGGHELKLIHHIMQTSQPHFQSAGRRRRSCHRDKTCSILDAVNSSSSDNDYIIDAVMEEKTAGLAAATTTTNVNDDDDDDDDNVTNTSSWWPRTIYNNNRDIFKNALRKLASLSLIDYEWRSALFKKAEAERREEDYMAKLMGLDDGPAHIRPMDANDNIRGPLGNAERMAVTWLTNVIEEEGKRARRIADLDGELVRPKDLSLADEAGPLSELERRAIQFLSDISDSEVARVRSGTIRPKDMASRSPLGEAEARAVLALDMIIESERTRIGQSRTRGEAVRPIDVPGPLGEFERYVGDIMRAERQRVKDRDANDGNLVRPKDASIKSGLSEVERKAVEDWEMIRKEEEERLNSIQRFFAERRPMEYDKDSPLGKLEAFIVRLLNGPKLLWKVYDRVKELLDSAVITEREQIALQRDQQKAVRDDDILDNEIGDYT